MKVEWILRVQGWVGENKTVSDLIDLLQTLDEKSIVYTASMDGDPKPFIKVDVEHMEGNQKRVIISGALFHGR